MTNILVTIPYCVKDVVAAKRLLLWMEELHGKYSRNAILLVADNDVPLPAKKELNEIAKNLFGQAETMLVDVPQGQQGRIHGGNQLFYQASRQVQECYRLPFLWLEPDAVPLKRMWLEEITKEYNASPKKFLGQFTRQGPEPTARMYLPACSVLPNNAHETLITGPRIKGWLKPWDTESAALTIARAQNTRLIQEHYSDPESPPTFSNDAGAHPHNCLSTAFIRKEAVLFHRCKDSTLIDLLGGKSKFKMEDRAIIEKQFEDQPPYTHEEAVANAPKPKSAQTIPA